MLFYRRKDLIQKPLNAIVPRLNKTFFTGMPVRTKQGLNCYLIEYRQGHACPLVLGLGDGIRIYTRMDQLEEDPDREDLSSINSMFKAKKLNEMKAMEEAERKGLNDSTTADSSKSGASNSKKDGKKASPGSRKPRSSKDKDRDCSIF